MNTQKTVSKANKHSIGQAYQAQLREKLFSKPLLLLFLSAFLFFMSYHLLTPVIPLYLEALGLDGQSIGFVVASFMAGSIFMRPFAGKWADEKDIMVLLLASSIVFTVSPLMFLITENIWLMGLARLLQGGCYAMFYTTALSAVLQYTPQSRRTEGISYFSNAMKLAVAISPLIAVYIAVSNNQRVNFWIASAIGGLCIASICYASGFIRQQWILPAKNNAKQNKKPQKGRLYNSHSLVPGLIMSTNSAVFGVLIPYAAWLSSVKGFPEAGGWFYTLYGGFLIVSRTFTGKWADSRGRHSVLLPGMFFVFVSILGIMAANSVVLFCLSAALYGFAAGTVQPSLMAITADSAPTDQQGSAMATFSLINDIGMALGSFLMGYLGNTFGIYPALGLTAFISLTGMIVYVVRYKKFLRQDLLGGWSSKN
ncbi:MAG: MFS transporter [Cyanobacteria bacterium P01_H01_bin.74]